MDYIEYKNLNSNSGIESYSIEENKIGIKFKDGTNYIYTRRKLGDNRFNLMKILASRGRKLNSFINKEVKDKYTKKIQ